MDGKGRSHRGSHGAETVTTSPRTHHDAADQFEPLPDRGLTMQQQYNDNIINYMKFDRTGKNTLFTANYRCDNIGILLCTSSQ
jgi:hypothetical protein